MMLFYTRSAEHLARKLDVSLGKQTIRKFKDGELYVMIEEAGLKGKIAWVIAALNPPAENLLELFFILDALKRAHARIKLVVTYFGYARQDRIVPGEAFTSRLICNWLSVYGIERIEVIHMHSSRLSRYLDYHNYVPVGFFLRHISKGDVLAAPDKGALPLARILSKKSGTPYVHLQKRRTGPDIISMKGLTGDVKGKDVVIVDDMISTGSTIIEASKLLKAAGARRISAVATHGIFAKGCEEKIDASPISKVYVTNTIFQRRRSHKIIVLDISPYIRKIMGRET